MGVTIECLSDAGSLRNFRCGVTEMDDFIQNGLRWSVEHHFCQMYVVKDDDILVALFALSFDSLEIDAEDKMDIVEGRAGDMVLSEEYKEVFFSKTHYPALGLTYLAVSENFQRQGWGKWIVEVIVEKARSQTFAGCQFLAVDALIGEGNNTIPFYTQCGFIPSENPSPWKDTRRMFRMLYTE